MAKRRHTPPTGADAEGPGDLRIVGGSFRGTKLLSEPHRQTTGAGAGQLVTRPMKHRVREAIFNLVGPEAEGKHAIDVFAGTGALGLEAISRGAASATFIERHVPTADVVRHNIASLRVEDRSELLITSAFVWVERDLTTGAWAPGPVAAAGPAPPWLVFVSPPYAFFVEREEQMLTLVGALIDHAPPGSIVVVEADERFDFERLPGRVKQSRHDDGWDVRPYPPAVVGVWRTSERSD
ncbi:RsmD family RNA methyltransferase [Botrimarina sp.]|uniref:RsmD family RNA methyltransferase n=1 Tax=Botrimarina sp. TaxID=2795802 RepID=UPI0032EE85C7